MEQTRWELENNVARTSAQDEELYYRFDANEQRAIQDQKPWSKDVNHFKK